MENISKYSYSRKISKSRNHGNVEEAITIALEAKERYPEENIFEKFLGDLYFQFYEDMILLVEIFYHFQTEKVAVNLYNAI